MAAEQTEAEVRRDRFVGCLLAGAVGDALGAGCEMLPADSIHKHYGEVRTYIREADQIFSAQRKRPYGHYTDDTEALLSVAQALIADQGKVRVETMAQTLVQGYHEFRGYSPYTSEVVQALKAGMDPHTVSRVIVPPDDWKNALAFQGDPDNGAAMRIAPLGLLASQVEDYELFYAAVQRAVLVTHFNAEAVDAAWIMAWLVSRLVAVRGDVDARRLVNDAIGLCHTSELQTKLQFVVRSYDQGEPLVDVLDAVMGFDAVRGDEAMAVVAAIFLWLQATPEEAVLTAVNLGGDCDTTAGMVGGLMGALHGTHWLPRPWIQDLEQHGAPVIAIAQALSESPNLEL